MDTSSIPDLSSVVVSERTCMRVSSRPELIPPLIDLLKAKAQLCGACHEARAGKLTLALHEALTNAIVHGNLEVSSELKERDDNQFARVLAERASNPHYASRQVAIEVDHDANRCRWSITDEGQGFDFARYLNSEPDPEALFLSSGRGILLMRAFVDQVDYDQGGRRVTLTLERASGIEKRQEPRDTLRVSVEVAPIRPDGSIDWDAAYKAVAQDLSPSGMGLLQKKLEASDRVMLCIESGKGTLYLPAEVRRCRAVGEGMVELGCQFLQDSEPLPTGADRPEVEEAVEQLLKSRRIVPRSVEERRLYTREPYTEHIELASTSNSPAVLGFARDLSKGGISFISTARLAKELRVICLPQPDGSMLRLQARIVRCVELTPGFYDVGATFVALEN